MQMFLKNCPHYHRTTRKKANYNILNEIPCLAPNKKMYCVVIWITLCCKLVCIGGGGGYNDYLECQICSFVKKNGQVIENENMLSAQIMLRLLACVAEY